MARARSRGGTSPRRRPSPRGRTSPWGRRKSSRRSRSKRSWLFPVVIAGLVLSPVVADFFTSRPGLLVFILVVLGVSILAAAGLYLYLVVSRLRREEELTRSVAGVDEMTGPQFERFVAALMRRTGFLEVAVSGGAGDLGADITALMPDGRLVVQCKRYQVGRPVGSPDVQKLAGTARTVHGADVAAIVTTSRFTKPAEELAAQMGIALVERGALARWAADGQPPLALLRPAGRFVAAGASEWEPVQHLRRHPRRP